MFDPLTIHRRAAVRLIGALSLLALAACVPAGGAGPSLSAGGPVPVALLVPAGSESAGDAALAQSLENAARLAISDLNGLQIDLQVYPTAAAPSQASTAASQAVANGAKVILGPVYSQNANAAGVAASRSGVSVLSFSNNEAIAGGNVYVLGNTFSNTATRLAAYAVAQGKSRIFIVHANSASEIAGRDAIATSVARQGGVVVGSAAFELSQQGVIDAIPTIIDQARAAQANALFFTSDNAGAMPFLAQLLPENGLSSAEMQFIGLGRLDIPVEALSQPGLQGAWFARPDSGLNRSFNARYEAAFGGAPHPLAGLAYDGIAAIAALAATGQPNALSRSSLTNASGFVGVNGIFRLRPDGTNQRGLAVAQIVNNSVTVISPAPRSFGSAGF